MVHLAVGMSRSVGNVSDLFRMETEIMFHCSHVRTYKQTHTCFMISCHTFHTSSYHHVIISSYHQYTYYMHQLINPRKLSNSSAWIFFARLLVPPGRALPGGTSPTRLGGAAGRSSDCWSLRMAMAKAVSAPLKAMARHEVDIQLPSGYD
jgi:hypothetical protein